MSKGLPKLLYSKDEAAQILNVPKTSIDWLLRKGTLPRRKIAGKIRFTLDDLQVCVEESKEDNRCNPVLRGDKKGA